MRPVSASPQRTRVTVNVIGHIYDLVGEKTIDVELENPTVRCLLNKMSTLYGEDLRKSIMNEKWELHVVLVNGMDIDFIKNLDTPLKQGDRVDILPLIAGG